METINGSIENLESGLIENEYFNGDLANENGNGYIIQSNGHVSNIKEITYTWRNINVWTNGPKEDKIEYFGLRRKPASKQILNNVAGICRPGELLALMGSSGAGKTTLLNVLTHRNRGNLKVGGLRTINGLAADSDDVMGCSSYVQQEDLLFPTLTVREHLNFQATLRMDKNISQTMKMARVDAILNELGLTKSSNTLIGSPMSTKGISGGEKKRLGIASEILNDPPLMFCDEPTSGLDSFMAQTVVEILKNMSNKGKTIIISIHQPSSGVFELFDRIMLMAQGRVAFLGDPQAGLNFFSNLGYPSQLNYNPADFFIMTMAILPDVEVLCKKKVSQICDAYTRSDYSLNLNNEIDGLLNMNPLANILGTKIKQSPYKAGWWTQFGFLLWRSILNIWRDPMLIKVRSAQVIAVSIFLGLVYFGQKLNAEGVSNINGGIFLFITAMTFLNMFSILNSFCSELPIFLREHLNGTYRTDTYFLARLIAELPLQIILPLIFTGIFYWMLGFNSDFMRFLTACGIVLLVSNTAAAFGYFLSAVANTVAVAMAYGPMMLLPLMIFGGLILNARSVAGYLKWIKYLSWFYYGNEALAINQWDGINYIDCLNVTSNCPQNGDVVLQSLDFDKGYFTRDIGLLALLMLFYSTLAFIVLILKTYKK